MKKAIKNTGTKIEKSKEKRIDVHFLWKREKKKEEKKKETTADNKSLIIYCHAPHYKEEDTLGLLKTQRKSRFGHRMVSHMLQQLF